MEADPGTAHHERVLLTPSLLAHEAHAVEPGSTRYDAVLREVAARASDRLPTAVAVIADLSASEEARLRALSALSAALMRPEASSRVGEVRIPAQRDRRWR